MNIKNSQDINSFDEENNLNNINNYEISNISSEQNDFKFSNNNIIKDNITNNYESISNTINTDKKNINNEDINNELINSNKKIDFNHSNDDNNNDNNNNNSKIISNLLYQLKKMSDKQLYLLDIISNLQKNSTEQINSLNKRIEELEEKVIKQGNKNQNYEDTDESFNINESDTDNPNIILKKLLNGNNYEQLIKYLKELRLEQIKKLEIKLIEDTLIKLCILLTEGFKVHEIISFIKGILIINKIKLKEITKKNLKDILNYVQQNLKNLKDEDSIDISLIISYLDI
jgi:hypothetical protein